VTDTIVPFVMDLKSIALLPEDGPPEIATVLESDGFFINRSRNTDFRLRKTVYDMLKDAQSRLPGGYRMMIYETYRAFARQEALWAETMGKMKALRPDLDEESLFRLCENFAACPYDGIGSGHMCACAVDLTLCDENGNEFFMGTQMHEMNEKTRTETAGLTPEEARLRGVLRKAMEDAGLANYPAEWWHFSYGDHQWAWLTGRKEAYYGILNI
jgi:D-alanyl-D-alanine dipeptidase